jgi:uncharacterized protein YdaU (DUF1376 family)
MTGHAAAKLPWMKFYPADWRYDTRCLSPSTRGIWIDMICTLWPTGSKTLPRMTWCRELSISEEEFTAAIQEIQAFSIAKVHDKSGDVTGDVTIESRRMLRDETTRSQTRQRVQRLRQKVNVTPSVTPKKRGEARVQSPEARVQRLEARAQRLEARGQRPETEIRSSGTVPDSVPKDNGVATWSAYADAYRDRYGVDPVRNQQTNSHLKNLVRRIGRGEAPAVAAFFLTHNDPFYVKARHPTNLLLRDCEGLRTQWATGTKATTGEMKNAEFKDNVLEQVKRIEALRKEDPR